MGACLPRGQSAQLFGVSAPYVVSFCARPAAQRSQDVAAARAADCCPGRHVVHRELPALGVCLPSGHALQAACVEEPWKRPATQGTQLAERIGSAEWRPGSQNWQLERPTASLNLPPGQGSHAVCVARLWYVPTSHATHVVEAFASPECRPTGHEAQAASGRLLVGSPGSENLPPGQAAQTAAASWGAKRPPAQAVQAVAGEDPSSNCPGTQASHAVCCGSVLKWPAAHAGHVASPADRAKVPGRQGVQSGCAVSGWCLPAGQASQAAASLSVLLL